jgi:hypothetical protein
LSWLLRDIVCAFLGIYEQAGTIITRKWVVVDEETGFNVVVELGVMMILFLFLGNGWTMRVDSGVTQNWG